MKGHFAILLGGSLLAGTTLAADQFGAIAYSAAVKAYGLSIDRGSKAEAEKAALNLCGNGGCEVVLTFRNGCGAMAVGARGYGGGTGTNPTLAEKFAMQSCAMYGGNGCSVTRRACTSNAKP